MVLSAQLFSVSAEGVSLGPGTRQDSEGQEKVFMRVGDGREESASHIDVLAVRDWTCCKCYNTFVNKQASVRCLTAIIGDCG